jgi:hypothetical protein
MPNNPFNPIAAKTRLRVNGTLGRTERREINVLHPTGSLQVSSLSGFAQRFFGVGNVIARLHLQCRLV